MYIRGKGEVFLLDRDNSVFSCPMLTFPSRAETQHLSDTLVDGVCLVQCSTIHHFCLPLPRSWLKTSCPMVFAHATWSMTSCSCLDDLTLHGVTMPPDRGVFRRRLLPLETWLCVLHASQLHCYSQCFSLQAQRGSLDKQAEPFSVRLKQFWDVRETRWVWICDSPHVSVKMFACRFWRGLCQS